jgi:TPR repeat protein
VLGANKRVRAYDYGTKPTAQEIAPVREIWEKEEAARIASEERTRKAAEQAKREAIETRQKQIEAARSATTARVVAYQHQQASNGSPSFQIELGKRFMRGDGVETNVALARHWLKSACTNGESEATNLLRQIKFQGASK